ncbi:MAG: PaaI family thioesterase [Bacteroidia bacterium]|nr:PaaI family thioesterase [Bacteroidia bacterium]
MSNPIKEYFQSAIGIKLKGQAPGLTGLLGGTLLKVEDSSITMEFEIGDELCNPGGFMHGGTHAAIMDDVMGMTVAALGNESHFVSVNLSLDMLGTVQSGGKVIATARVIRKGRQIINVMCEIATLDGKVISRGTQNLVISNLPKINENQQPA